MATLYDLQSQYKLLQNFIEEGDAEGFELALSQIKDEIGVKLEGYAMVMKNIQSDIEGLKAEEKRLAERRRAMETNVERMKQSVYEALLTVEGNKVKTDKFTFSFRKSKSVLVLDETVIPHDFVRVKTEVDKKSIAAALKAGQEISGVQLVENQSLSIR